MENKNETKNDLEGGFLTLKNSSSRYLKVAVV